MPIVYEKAFALMKKYGISAYDRQKNQLLSRDTERQMQSHTGGPSYKVLCRLCEVLHCQPGDLMEYIPEEGMPAYLEKIEAEKEKSNKATPAQLEHWNRSKKPYQPEERTEREKAIIEATESKVKYQIEAEAAEKRRKLPPGFPKWAAHLYVGEEENHDG